MLPRISERDFRPLSTAFAGSCTALRITPGSGRQIYCAAAATSSRSLKIANLPQMASTGGGRQKDPSLIEPDNVI